MAGGAVVLVDATAGVDEVLAGLAAALLLVAATGVTNTVTVKQADVEAAVGDIFGDEEVAAGIGADDLKLPAAVAEPALALPIPLASPEALAAPGAVLLHFETQSHTVLPHRQQCVYISAHLFSLSLSCRRRAGRDGRWVGELG